MVVRYGVLNGEVAFLQKPFNIGTLSKKIRDVLDGKIGTGSWFNSQNSGSLDSLLAPA
jgi:hypothetical protein